MKHLKSILILWSIFILTECGQICYDNFGCFTDEYPFGGSLSRPLSILPQAPNKINTKFYLFNKKLRNKPQSIDFLSLSDNFNVSIPTKFIIHGFMDTSDLPWIIDMKEALIDYIDCNVVVVDWSGGNGLPYTRATANTQIVGIEVAKLIEAFIQNKGVNAKSFHLIGHSLGAHVSGYAGKMIKGLGRISGLDPAGPYFEDTPKNVRLDINDADFVDIIHTNGLKMIGNMLSVGIKQSIGHVDYYVNGGEYQPGCWLTDFNFDPACSHEASEKFYTDSIKNECAYIAYPCNNTDDYYSGECLNCNSEKDCNRMGYWSTYKKDNQVLYLDTQSIYNDRMCVQNYQVILKSKEMGSKKAKGKFSIMLETATEKSSHFILDNGKTSFKSRSIHKFLVSLDNPLKTSPITSATIIYEKNFDLFNWIEKTWIFDSIEIFSAESQSRLRLCPINISEETSIKYGQC